MKLRVGSPWRRGRLPVTALVALLVIGGGVFVWNAANAVPDGLSLAIKTEPNPPTSNACMEAVLADAHVTHRGRELVTVSGLGVEIVWPYGYTARLVDGKALVLDAGGNPVVREGETFDGGGGFGADDAWHLCTIEVK